MFIDGGLLGCFAVQHFDCRAEEGGSMFLRNVIIQTKYYGAQQPRRPLLKFTSLLKPHMLRDTYTQPSQPAPEDDLGGAYATVFNIIVVVLKVCYM
jgi:hypothetical protein